jgi:hypothetical protein
MLNLKVGLLGVVLLGATIAVACSSTSDNKSDQNTTAVQAQEKPEYPPLYHVEVQVCGDIVAPIKNGERCLTNQLRLWGPVDEAKLIRTGISLPSLQSVEHKIAISSKGCYPVYAQPSQEQFYWVDSIIQVNKGTTPTVQVQRTQLSSEQVAELLSNKLTKPTIQTFGGVGCQPATSVK